MSIEWIILYFIILGSAVYIRNAIHSPFDVSDILSDIRNSLERIEDEVSKFYEKFYENKWKDGMEPMHHMEREENPPTIYDITDELESISSGIDDIGERLDEIIISKND